MKREIYILVLVVVVLGHFNFVSAQDSYKSSSSLSVSTYVGNRHLWRGFESIKTMAFKSNMDYSFKNINIGAWGLYSIDNSYQEIDLYLSYKWKNLKVTLYDYYCPNIDYVNSDFFNYSKDSTVHIGDLLLNYTVSNKFPLSITGSFLFAGNDKDENNNNNYSYYFEMSYPIVIKDKTLKLTAGAGSKGMYGNNFGFTNISVYFQDDIKIKDIINLPISVGTCYSPMSKNLYLICSIGISN